MNETLNERMNSGFANIAIRLKIFEDKLDLVNEKCAFLEKKQCFRKKVPDPQVRLHEIFEDKLDLINEKWSSLEKKHDMLEKKVSDTQSKIVNYKI